MLSYHCAGGDYTTTTTTTFHCPLVLQYNVPPHLLEAQEQTFIQHFQPKLNFPYISPHMKRAFRGISQPSHKITARSGLRSIWAKLCRRHLPRNIAPLHRSPTFQRQSPVWRTLCDLASNTKRRFDNSRELHRRRTPLAISHNQPPPHHLPAGKAIATAMRKRKLHRGVRQTPKDTGPITQLAKSTSRVATKSLTLMHLPTTQAATSHTCIPRPCRNTPSCTRTRATFSSVFRQKHLLPPEKQLRKSLAQAIHCWHKQHHLPASQEDDATIQQFVSQQMTLHHQHQQQTLNLHIVKSATRCIPTGIVHCEDHFPNRLTWYCPTIYADAISATFLDESVTEHTATHTSP